MARIAILTLEAAGHLYPCGSLGRELRRRGHEVVVVARDGARPIADRLELPMLSLPEDASNVRPRMPFLQIAARPFRANWAVGLLARLIWRTRLFIKHAPALLEEFKPDLALVDQNILVGGTIADRAGVPWVTVCSALMSHEEPGIPPAHLGWAYSPSRWARLRNRLGHASFHVYLGPVWRIINRQRRDWGLPPVRQAHEFLSPYAQLSQLVREFDFPREALPDTCHYCGALAASRVAEEVPFPWEKLDGRPVVFASLGTVRSTDNFATFRTIAAACAGIDAQLVLTLGQWQDESINSRDKLGELAGNPLVVGYVPQLALLKRTNVLVTHAGQNTVLESIHAGVPMVALPRSADQPAMASRIEYKGLGLRDSFHSHNPERLRGKIQRVLTEDSFRQRTAEMQQIVRQAGGSTYAADVVEQVLATGKPVTRAEMQSNAVTGTR